MRGVGVYISMKDFTNEEKSYILEAYKNKSKIVEISKTLRVRQERVSNFLKSQGIRIRTSKDSDKVPYSLNKEAFSSIETEESAYFLGFMYADGYVSSTSNQICLCINDEEILNEFKRFLSLDKEIYKNPNHSKAKTLFFSSREIKYNLIKHGCTPKKSLTLKFPNQNIIPLKLLPHFIRGYFDGDGSVYGVGQKRQVKIISSTDFCIGLKEVLESFGIACGSLRSDERYKKETSYFRITGFLNVNKFKELIYNESSIFLSRKFNKF